MMPATGTTTTCIQSTTVPRGSTIASVLVHPFPNGNGRCTRVLADLYLLSLGARPFSGATGGLDGSAEAQRDVRRAYIAALEAAPADDCDALVTFARS